MDAAAMVNGYKEELIDKLGQLVGVNSVQGEALPDAPFGEKPKEVLNKALAMMKKDGFKTVNLDNYIGYAEMGEGREIIGIIGHLDVVPAYREDGWDSDPFKMVEKGGILYGRGVSDDKGAVVASMIAMKVVRDMKIPLNKRIRLIMGTNEETGSKCLAHYVEKEGSVDLGFTPDGEFPGVHGEKGMIAMRYRSKKTSITDIKGGTAANIVCQNCMVKLPRNMFSPKSLVNYFNNEDIKYTIEDEGEKSVIRVSGTAAHGSMPEKGVNALSHLMKGLETAGCQDPFVKFYNERFGLDTDGKGIGAKCEDEYGALTLNNGVIAMQDGVISGSVDIRFPVTMSAKKVLRLTEGFLEDENGVIEVMNTVEPLYFPVDSPLVEALVEAYREVTGDSEAMPMTMGGGTYAKGIDNTIAFGCAFPGKNYRIHDANEWVPVSDLLKQAEIYVAAIRKLLAV